MGNSPFFGIEIGLRALQSFKTAMEVISHNVANANTPGYSRQKVNLTATFPYTFPSFFRPEAVGQMGTGVKVTSIERLRDDSIERQIRTNTHLLEEFKTKEDMFHRIEAIFNEPGSVGLSTLLNDFFNSFQELSTSPESSVVRAQVRQKGESLANYFNRLAWELKDLQEDVDNNVRVVIDGINTLLHEIRDVNELITGIVPTGDNPNDLLDQRDHLLEELSKLVDIEVSEDYDKTVNVFIGGRVVVQRDIVKELVAVDDPSNNSFASIKIEGDLDGPDVLVSSGELKALLDIRDDTEKGIPYYQNQLDTLAYNLIEKVNAQHRAGFGLDGASNRNFFVPASSVDTALNMSLDTAITDPVNGLDRIAAASSATGIPGDGSNALLIAQLQNDPTGVGSSTFNDFYNSIISQLGVFTEEESSKRDNQDFLLNQLYNFRDAVSGVSLDEEAAKLISYENAFNAASQVIKVMNDIYETLIDMMGV